MRPSLDQTWLAVAKAVAERGTCLKMKVGCVLADRHGRMLSANYNGVAAGLPHCNAECEPPPEGQGGSIRFGLRADGSLAAYPHTCAGAGAPAGADLCEAIHAEQNALTWCLRPDLIHTCYVTVSPCMRCVKQLMGTPCRRIVFLEEYDREPQAKRLWLRSGSGRRWIHHAA